MLKKLKAWIENLLKPLKPKKKKVLVDDWDDWYPDHDLFI